MLRYTAFNFSRGYRGLWALFSVGKRVIRTTLVSRDEFPSHDGNCFCGRGVFLVDSCSASLAISQFVSDLSPKVLKQLLVSSDPLLSLLLTRLSEPNHSSSDLHQMAGDMLL
jgi:hypothetical protein